MDLHVVAPIASPAERAAVDAVLDPVVGQRSGWRGGSRDMAAEGHVARGGHEARAHRDLLLPALHAVQARIGYISQPALGYVCRRLTIPPAEAYGVATFYALFATTPRPPVAVHVCDDIACRLAGAEDLCGALERALGPAGEPAARWTRDLAPEPMPGPLRAGARRAVHGRRGGSPVVRRGAGRCGRHPGQARGGGRTRRPEATTRRRRAADRRATATPDPPDPAAHLAAVRESVPQAGTDGLRLLARVGRVDPTSLEATAPTAAIGPWPAPSSSVPTG